MRQCIICQGDISQLHGRAVTCEGACRRKHKSNRDMKKYNAQRPQRFCEVCNSNITHMDGLTKGCSRECKRELVRQTGRARYAANPEKYRSASLGANLQAYNEFAAKEPELYSRIERLLLRSTRHRAEQIVKMIIYSNDKLLRRFRGSFKGDALLVQYAPKELT